MQKHPPFLFEQLEECFIRVYPFAMCGALLAFGPVMRSDIEKRYPERREELLAVMREKMIAQTMAYDNDSDDEKRILGTSVEWSCVEEKLRCALQTESRFGANKSANRIGMGQGFVSYICRLHLDWIPKNEDLPQTVVIKIPAIDITRQLIKVMNTEGEMEKAANSDPEILLAKFEPMLRRCHNTEVSFYELVHSSGMHIKVPETYVLQKFTEHCNQGFIVMADQGTDATVLSLFNNVTPEEIMQVFDSLAEVNAYSLAHPECFANITTTSLADLFQIHDQTSMLPGMLKSVTNLDEEKLGPLTEEVEGYIKEILDPTIVSRLHEEMGMKPVLSHGDLWTANVIWKSDGERRNLAAIIDWQLAHPGTPSEDMARMMAASLSAKDRRNHLNGILEHYYNKLTELLRTEPPFTFQQLKDSFVRIYAFEMLAVAPGLGALMQTQVENLPEEEKASLLELMREKAIGLFEDIIYYYKLNKQT
uniref:Oxidoreductase dhs-27 n=2 Tax=Ascaris TaxID=6251 RepID=F1KVK0_ASCSU